MKMLLIRQMGLEINPEHRAFETGSIIYQKI